MGRRDVGRHDAGRRDAGRREAGRREAGRRDAGRRDAGRRDAGSAGAWHDAARRDACDACDVKHYLPSTSTSLIKSSVSSSVGFLPRDRITEMRAFVVIVPSPFLS